MLGTDTPRPLSSPTDVAMLTSPATSGPCRPATAAAQAVQLDTETTTQAVDSQASNEIAWEGSPGSALPAQAAAAEEASSTSPCVRFFSKTPAIYSAHMSSPHRLLLLL